MLAAHVHKTPDILAVIVNCRRTEGLVQETLLWVPEVFWKDERPFDVVVSRNISEVKTRAHVDHKSTLLLLTCIGPAHASPTYASHEMTKPMAIMP